MGASKAISQREPSKYKGKGNPIMRNISKKTPIYLTIYFSQKEIFVALSVAALTIYNTTT
jgi:hypothetical protein